MSNFAKLFSGANFQHTIRKYCNQIGWNISDLDSKRAALVFTMSSGRRQFLMIYRYEETLEFTVPSIASFPSEDALPHYLSTILLRSNAQNRFGFWCIEQTPLGYTYSMMHNAELELMNVEFFAGVVSALLKQCDDFEEILVQMMRR